MTGKTVRFLGATYLALLVASFAVRHLRSDPPPRTRPGDAMVQVRAVDGDRILDRTIRLSYEHLEPSADSRAPVVVLLHGSPGGKRDFDALAPRLAERYRVIVPDLPGFGAGERDVPDYSFRAHARYVLELMDALGLDEAHVVGFSMGGGVVLSMADLAPRRVRSITMLSAIGVQEMELLGNYELNHALHGAQLVGLWGLRELTPHFGALDRSMLGVSYARNFYDSDQRPLRRILSGWDGPMLIIHGERDPLVPVQAAREHARLVPQSELVVTRESHFMVFRDDDTLASTILPFLARVDRGDAVVRVTADPARVQAAARPFDPASLPELSGFPRVLTLTLIAGSTLISEDLSCIGAGLLVAAGRLAYVPAMLASLIGIFVGDVLLFLFGRVLGRPLLARPPFRWFVSASRLEKSSVWFRERGPAVILASRFLPGTRFTTYVAAGVLRTSFWTFMLWFGIAALLWTPLLVGAAALVGTPVLAVFRRYELLALPAALIVLVVVGVASRTVPLLFSWKGRRLLQAAWRRTTRWEYWPPYVFYPPVVLYGIGLGIRHRGLTTFTAANPAIPAGGFIGESKAAIFRGLAGAGDAMPPWCLLPAGPSAPERVSEVRRFAAEAGLALPIVLKPDVGQRGSGVAIAKSWDEVEAYLAGAPYDVLAQAFVHGPEFGVFYVRRPSERHGRIFAITEKEIPVVRGDGRRTLEQLILDDPRTLPMASIYLDKQHARLHEVVPDGETVPLVELGTHCRGAYFHEGMGHLTPELEKEVDRVTRTFDGFYFGRYDVRSPSVEAFHRGEFKVIELNGVTSEATSIYDRTHGVFDAYRTLFAQWRLAFEIGAENRARGTHPAGLFSLLGMLARYRARAAEHVEDSAPKGAGAA